MPSWREMAAAVLEQPAPSPLRSESYGLSDGLASDLRRLNAATPPRVVGRGAWRPIVDDALRIARDGWAASALALGWSEADLFGIGPYDDLEFAGLAVWLRGRTIVVVDEARAIVADGDRRAAYNRRKVIGCVPVMLWQFGR